MAHIQKLSIQGIRSFNPEEPKIIDFFPLTIIIGPNGAGKTSIIESLKYATAGVMPPNSNGGKTFIHDIQYANQSIIRGQVRLKFTDIEKKDTVITRSIQSTLKYTKNKPSITFRQINSVIRRDGKSIDQKCADINSELLELVGVSKAVLNNVIFCHQEETNWPLSDGKVLKEKFDDIFGSIGYVKALEKIKKIREEEVRKHRELENIVKYVGMLKKEADNKRRLLNEEKAKFNLGKEDVKKLEIKMKEINEQLEDLIEKESNADELMNEISQINGSIAEKKKLADEIQKTCNLNNLTKNKEQVDYELTNFDTNAAKLKLNKKELLVKLQNTETEYFALMKDKQTVSTDIAKISEFEKQLKRYCSERNTLICKLNDNKSDDIKLIVNKINENAEVLLNDSKVVQHYCQLKIDQTKDDLNDRKSAFIEKETNLKKDLDLLKSNYSNANHEKQLWNSELEKIKEELQEHTNTLNRSNMPENFLEDLQMRINEYRMQMDKFKNNKNDDEFKENIQLVQTEKSKLKDEIDQLNEKITFEKANIEERTKLTNLKEQNDSKIDKIKLNNLEIFTKIGVVKGNFYDSLMRNISEISANFDKSSNLLTSYGKEFYTKRSKLESVEDLMAKKSKELTQLKNKFDNLCDIDNFDDFFSLKEKELNELRLEKSKLSNISPVIDWQISVIDKLQTCPVCESDLSCGWTSKKSNTKLDCQNLMKQLEKTKNDNPAELSQLNIKIQKMEKLYGKLLLLKNDIETIKKISIEIPSLENNISDLKKEVDRFQKCMAKENEQLDYNKNYLVQLRNSLQDAREYDNSIKELKEVNQKLQEISKNNLSTHSDIENMQFSLKHKRLNLEQLDRKVTTLQDEMSKFIEERNFTQNLLQTAERKKLDFEKQQHDQSLIIYRKQELTDKMDKLNMQIVQQNKISKDLHPKIEKLQHELTKLNNDFNTFEKETQQRLVHYENSLKQFNTLQLEIDKYSRELNASKMKTSKDYIVDIENKLLRSESLKKEVLSEVNKLSQDIANLEIQKKELEDCNRLLELRSSINEQEEKLKLNKSKMGFMDLSSIKRLRIRAERDSQSLVTKKQNCYERNREIDKRVSSISAELEQDEYRNVEKNYRDKLTDMTISELACDDLNKYYKALDFSISSFHKCKMEEINKLIKKFWQIAYQGNDIDYIKIFADEDERSATDRRRTFNYRVVMVRKSKEMDMKGRCSAGQKVLASLVIRLALAVIFCRNFPVLTLDEPTTNLDKSNIHSFAKAVINLIKSNRNFQIVIITHDEEFLDCLDSDTGEHYYKVFKDENGYSSISRKSILEDTNIFVGQNGKSTNLPRTNEDDQDDIPMEIAPKIAKLEMIEPIKTTENSFFNLNKFDDSD